MGVFNFREQVGFYAQYHNNRVNQLIHMIFVPTILFTALVFVTQVGPNTEVPPLPPVVRLNLALFTGIFYNLYYIALEPLTGLLYVPFMCCLVYGANLFVATVPNPLLVALAIHVSAWIAQFFGHGVYEKRKPSLLDNLLQSLVMAPFFVWLETLFLFGYRPKLAKEIKDQAERDIAQWKASKAKTN